MWGGESFMRVPGAGGEHGGGHLGSKSAPCSPVKPLQKRAPAQPDSFHVIHKVPLGDSPYVRAKHVQLVDKDPDAAIALFWAAINAGDRVDSALKDMAIVMKQQNRPEEAIEAIKSLRCRCSDVAQESLDNVLLDLYKRCGRLDDQITLLKHKLHLIHQGMAFNGKRTKTARSQGKKFQVSIEQEATRLLGNLGWAYMQQNSFLAAEAVYRKALSIGPDNNKVCNLGICLMKQGRMEEAKAMLQSVVPACPESRWGSDSHLKSYERAQEMLVELEASMGNNAVTAAFPALGSSLVSKGNGGTLRPWIQSAATAATASVTRSKVAGGSSRTADISLDSLADFGGTAFSGALSATAGFGPTISSSRPAHKKSLSSMGGGGGQQQQQQQQQEQEDRFGSRDIGGLNNSSNSHQFLGYHHHHQHKPILNTGRDDFELGYASPDENVDTNVRGFSAATRFRQQQQLQQQQVRWPGETLRLKQDSFTAALMNSKNENHRHQSVEARKLERSTTFGAPLQRDAVNSLNGSDNVSCQQQNKFPFPQFQKMASGNFVGKMSSSSHAKPSEGDQVPVGTYAAASAALPVEELGASVAKHINTAWGTKLSSGGPPPMKPSFGSSELSFFSRWGYNENRPAGRRSLSLESFDTQLEQIALENGEAEGEEEVVSLTLPLQMVNDNNNGIHVKRPRNQTPVKEKASGLSLWNSLGYSLSHVGEVQYSNEEMKHMSSLVSTVVSSPSSAAPPAVTTSEHVNIGVPGERNQQQQQPVAFACHTSLAAAAVGPPAADTEMIKRQRRLRVFQEITLFPRSPQQVGV